MTKPYNTLKFEQQGRLITITLDRPEAANGLNMEMAAELVNAAQRCATDSEIKAVILTGAGAFFCAGGDVKTMYDLGENVGQGLQGLADDLHKAISLFSRMDVPLIVAINGTAAGGGFSLALSGDYLIAADTAKLTMAYSKIGLSPDGSSSYYLPRLIGIRKTQEMMFNNTVLSAEQAEQWGLINKVVAADELMDAASAQAEVFLNGAAQSNSAIKKLLLASFNNDLEAQMQLEGETIARNAATADGREGVAAFVEKRAPKFG